MQHERGQSLVAAVEGVTVDESEMAPSPSPSRWEPEGACNSKKRQQLSPSDRKRCQRLKSSGTFKLESSSESIRHTSLQVQLPQADADRSRDAKPTGSLRLITDSDGVTMQTREW